MNYDDTRLSLKDALVGMGILGALTVPVVVYHNMKVKCYLCGEQCRNGELKKNKFNTISEVTKNCYNSLGWPDSYEKIEISKIVKRVRYVIFGESLDAVLINQHKEKHDKKKIDNKMVCEICADAISKVLKKEAEERKVCCPGECNHKFWDDELSLVSDYHLPPNWDNGEYDGVRMCCGCVSKIVNAERQKRGVPCPICTPNSGHKFWDDELSLVSDYHLPSNWDNGEYDGVRMCSSCAQKIVDSERQKRGFPCPICNRKFWDDELETIDLTDYLNYYDWWFFEIDRVCIDCFYNRKNEIIEHERERYQHAKEKCIEVEKISVGYGGRKNYIDYSSARQNKTSTKYYRDRDSALNELRLHAYHDGYSVILELDYEQGKGSEPASFNSNIESPNYVRGIHYYSTWCATGSFAKKIVR